METTTPSRANRLARASRALRTRWAQVCIVLLVWLFALTLSARHFGPKEPGKGEKADTSRFKFLHCDKCKSELPYNKDLDGKRCAKCQPPDTGFYIPTEGSIKGGSQLPPWTKAYVAMFVETVVLLAVLTFLLYLPVHDPTKSFFVVACPYCNQRLRYRAVSHGGLGSCSRCKRLLRFPPEEQAVREEDLLRADEQAARAEAEAQARAAEEAGAE